MVQIDMKKPAVCGDCRFIDYAENDYPFCLVLRAHRGYPFDINKKCFPNCPLKEVEEAEPQKAELNDDDRNIMRVLFNRCRAVMSADGMMCMFCGMKEKCAEMKSV